MMPAADPVGWSLPRTVLAVGWASRVTGIAGFAPRVGIWEAVGITASGSRSPSGQPRELPRTPDRFSRVGALLVRWMLRRTHRRLCATTEQWLDSGERVTDVAVGNRTWTLWPWAGGMALMLASVVALSRTSGPLGVGLFLAAWVFLLAPVLTVPSIVLVATRVARLSCSTHRRSAACLGG
jgi:hypothetical protein